jgi:hypothetical protein
MTTTGSTLFNMDFTDIAEEAWERAGREMRSGYDLRTARRSMNLMTIEWQNRGINMWTIDEGYVNLVQGVAEYDLPADTIDLMEQVIRTGAGNVSTQADLTITRISVSTYATIPNKLTQARPIQVWVQRLRDNPKITVWPVPDQGTSLQPYYVFKYWRLRRIDDAGSGIQTQDVNFRFYPAMAAGLAYHIAMKVPELAGRVEMLKAAYDEQFNLAAGEDREKAAIRFVPRQMFIGSGV